MKCKIRILIIAMHLQNGRNLRNTFQCDSSYKNSWRQSSNMSLMHQELEMEIYKMCKAAVPQLQIKVINMSQRIKNYFFYKNIFYFLTVISLGRRTDTEFMNCLENYP